MSDRVGRYQKEEIDRAYDRISEVIGPSFDSFDSQIRVVLEQLYLAGASWGEQDAASDASIEIKDLQKEIRDLTDSLNSHYD